MTKIRAFRAVRYNQDRIKDMAKVVCPPYDIISPERQGYLHDRSPYNLIHILLGKDIPGNDKYRRARDCFKNWLREGILIQETQPAIYFYSQQYSIKGQKRTRLGFIALLHLGEKGEAAFRHEATRLEPKEDRLRLLKQVRANLSPIFAVFLDKKRIIQRTWQKIEGLVPFIDLVDDELTRHKLWKLDSLPLISSIEKDMSAENIFIADGHHRYEVACMYRELMRKKMGVITQGEPFNYTLAYFTNTDQRGLLVLPIHRLVKLDSIENTRKILSSLGDYFVIEEVKDKARFFFLMEKAGQTEHLLGMYKEKSYWLLRLKNVRILDKEMPEGSKACRSLDISILNAIILKKTLGLNPEDPERVIFSPLSEEFITAVDNSSSCIAFFLNPVKIQQIISVALGGERMPPKSTYFYPKVLSGLVINKFNEGKV